LVVQAELVNFLTWSALHSTVPLNRAAFSSRQF